MAYHSAGGIFDSIVTGITGAGTGGSVVDKLSKTQGRTSTDPDKVPGSAPDIVKIWADMKTKLRDDLGIYRLPDGKVVVLPSGGGLKAFPMLTFVNAVALMNGWGKFAGALANAVQKEGRDPSRATEALGLINRERIDVVSTLLAQSRVNCDSSGRCQRPGPGGKFLLPTGTKVVFDMIDAATLKMSLGVWSAFNIETSMERMEEALDETPGGFILKAPIQAGFKIAELVHKGVPRFLAGFGKMLTVAKFAAVGYAGYLVYDNFIKKE